VRRVAFLSALVVGLTSLAAVAADPVTGTIEAVKVVVGDHGEEIYLPADEARPRDVIEYRLTYANNGGAVVHNFSITDPVPAGLEYVAKTARHPQAGAVQFSVDQGRTFHAWPVRVKKVGAGGRESWSDATPDMVTHIRWTVSGDLKPEGEIELSYRAKVK
jgi:uncharacterized repeat protein (TIGR01451 family)